MSEHQSTMDKIGTLLASGDVVAGLDSVELVEIQRVAPFGGKTLVEGVGVQSRRLVQRPLAALLQARQSPPRFLGATLGHRMNSLIKLSCAHRQVQYLVEESDWVGHGQEVAPPPDTRTRRE